MGIYQLSKIIATLEYKQKNAFLSSQNFGLRTSGINKLRTSDILSYKIKIFDSKRKKIRIIPIETLEQKENLAIRKICIFKMIESKVLTNEKIRWFAGHEDFSTTEKYYEFST